jgi:hypothetical protein
MHKSRMRLCAALHNLSIISISFLAAVAESAFQKEDWK